MLLAAILNTYLILGILSVFIVFGYSMFYPETVTKDTQRFLEHPTLAPIVSGLLWPLWLVVVTKEVKQSTAELSVDTPSPTS